MGGAKIKKTGTEKVLVGTRLMTELADIPLTLGQCVVDASSPCALRFSFPQQVLQVGNMLAMEAIATLRQVSHHSPDCSSESHAAQSSSTDGSIKHLEYK